MDLAFPNARSSTNQPFGRLTFSALTEAPTRLADSLTPTFEGSLSSPDTRNGIPLNPKNAKNEDTSISILYGDIFESKKILPG